MNSLLQNLQLPQETAQHKQAEEKNVLLLLRNKLKKLNKEAALGYSDEFIDQKTETEENFLKAAEEESETIWNGFVEQLEKEGANQSFIQGMLKEAAGSVEDQLKQVELLTGKPIVQGFASTSGGLFQPENASQPLQVTIEPSTPKIDPVAAAKTTNTPIDVKPFPESKSLLTATEKDTAPGVNLDNSKIKLTPQQTPHEARNDLPGTGPSNQAHSILGGIPNKFTGALGGGLFALLGANMLGLKGPMKWLLPVLGGAAGYKFFPHIMNLAKDRMGEGVNRMGSGSANIFRKIVQQN